MYQIVGIMPKVLAGDHTKIAATNMVSSRDDEAGRQLIVYRLFQMIVKKQILHDHLIYQPSSGG